ncbi:MAG: methylmalonyl Co-A mutase-associated GTPase MeaB [Candidatus Lokiarchaeota archaeon]|nr:methylmalonyl Co-A mutase-associated GTPase MeaB [Candidatus Lokiarchaeota archaeon]
MYRKDDIDELMDRFFNGDRQALARTITYLESYPEKKHQIMKRIFPKSGNAYVIGLTGVPGAGKSTIISKLAKEIRNRGKTVGIVCVDPSSPYSGGAFLGDRCRMNAQEFVSDKGIFIRSLASRGELGGLARATDDVVTAYDAYGMDYIIVETVGAGQSEVSIKDLAYTVVVIFVPNLGDSIQAQKAGIIEIGDILVINKSDLGGDHLKVQLDQMLDTYTRQTGWRPPIVRTVAVENKGIPKFLDEIERHKKHMELSGILEKKWRTRFKNRFYDTLKYKISNLFFKEYSKVVGVEEEIDKVIDKEIDFYSSVDKIFNRIIDKIKEEL